MFKPPFLDFEPYTHIKMKVGAQFTVDKSMFIMFMVINHCNKNGAPTMAFTIMVKVAHFVFTTHHSEDHNFYT